MTGRGGNAEAALTATAFRSGSGPAETKQVFRTSFIPSTVRTTRSLRFAIAAFGTGPPMTATPSTMLTTRLTRRSSGSASRAASAQRASTISESPGAAEAGGPASRAPRRRSRRRYRQSGCQAGCEGWRTRTGGAGRLRTRGAGSCQSPVPNGGRTIVTTPLVPKQSRYLSVRKREEKPNLSQNYKTGGGTGSMRKRGKGRPVGEASRTG